MLKVGDVVQDRRGDVFEVIGGGRHPMGAAIVILVQTKIAECPAAVRSSPFTAWETYAEDGTFLVPEQVQEEVLR